MSKGLEVWFKPLRLELEKKLKLGLKSFSLKSKPERVLVLVKTFLKHERFSVLV